MQNIDQIRHLVDGFRINIANLKDSRTPEAVIRQEYIDAFWKILGWDVSNKAHRSLAQKDVVIEAPIGTVEAEKIRSRRPDYLFRVDGFPRFILEAKKPTVDITKDKDAIFQAKTYAWSAQIPFAILMNYDQFRLFDTTLKPYHGQPNKGLITDFDLRFDDYPEQWDVITKTFGREAVANGSLEELLAKIKNVRKGRRIRSIDRMLIDLKGSEPVDKAFLKHLEDYRLRFAKEIYKENKKHFPEADTRHGAAKLTEAAQRFIDRIVFIRVCEDRNITTYGTLRNVVNYASENRLDLYSELISEFQRFDHLYNGFLFKPHFSEQLTLSADLLADFVRSLYLPDAPYRFDAIGDDLLGIIYERFLGCEITVRHGRVTAEEKPEVRHAGGVYYTPKFVVDTIIRKTVKPKIEGKTPEDLLDIKILDPACGSGSFLIAALQYLYDYCIHCFEKDPKSATVKASQRARSKTRAIGFQDDEGNWHLYPDLRGQLLANCIYGVDIDGQAVEVTIMSLYLKMLEGKLPENWQQDFLQSRLLPSLDNNIRCGNSLISQTDFDVYWENKFNDLFGGDEDVRFRMNPFDWTSETRGFGRIFDEKGGFDCIIGNPPYIRVQELKKWAPEECEFYKSNYKSASKGNYDIYVVFVEKAIQVLNSSGKVGFILPNKFLSTDYGLSLRRHLSSLKLLSCIVDFGHEQVFSNATIYTCLLFLDGESHPEIQYTLVKPEQLVTNQPSPTIAISVSSINSSPWQFFNKEEDTIKSKIHKNAILLLDLPCRISRGSSSGADDVFCIVKQNGHYLTRDGQVLEIEDEILRQPLYATSFSRYSFKGTPNEYIIFPYHVSDDNYSIIEEKKLKEKYPLAYNYLLTNKSKLETRKQYKEWYGYSAPRNLNLHDKSDIIIPLLANKGLFSQTPPEIKKYCIMASAGFSICIMNEKFSTDVILGLLNSKLLFWYLNNISNVFRAGWITCTKQYFGLLPIKIPTSTHEQKKIHSIEKRSLYITELNAKMAYKKMSEHEIERIERQIESYQNQIDHLVYDLYDLTDEEKRIVEEAAK